VLVIVLGMWEGKEGNIPFADQGPSTATYDLMP
jgi:hypothetical protein